MALKITEPKDDEQLALGKEITIKGTVDSDISKIEIYADDRWLLGRTQPTDGNWSISYPFNTAGQREIIAKGFDSANKLITSDEIWVSVKEAPANLIMKLTEDFPLWQLVQSTTADRLRIDNTPTPREIENLRRLCQQILQPARDALGPLQINSGFRSAALNRAVGGVPNSDHRKGFAADVIPANVSTKKFAEFVANNCEFDQVILEFGTAENPNWIHVSANPRNRKQKLRITDSSVSEILL